MTDTPTTNFISMDEPAILLYETNGPALDSQSLRRWRHILVVRNDKPADYVTDMGLASDFSDELSIPGGVAEGGRFVSVEKVGDLMDFADGLRNQPFDVEDIVLTDLEGGYHDVMEQRQLVLAGGV